MSITPFLFRLFASGVFCLFLVPSASVAASAPRSEFRKPATVTPALTHLKKHIDDILGKRDVEAGVIAVSLQTSEVLYEKDADRLLLPASVMKLFTAYTALKKLGPTFTLKTTVHVRGVIRDGKLNGDLYIKGGGDPSLVSERLWMLCNELVRSGIRTITGNIVVDSSYFDEEKTPESRPKYLKDQAYNAPVGALSFNFNTTTIYVKPGETVGATPVVYTDPENSYIDIVNQASTGRSGSRNSIQVSRTDFVKGDIGDTVLLRGSIPLDTREMRFYKNIVNPALYTGHMFKTFWEQRGLKFTGNVQEAIVPANAKQILEFDSLPLWQIIWGMDKFSNNFVADQLFKIIGAEVWGVPGTRQKGLSALQDTLEDIGIKKDAYAIQDGSGLTRATKVTARQILKILTAMHKDFSIGPEAMASLPIAGEDGSLRKRMTKGPLEGLLRAKTGTLDGGNALAGFAPSADDELLAFVVLLNDPKVRYGSMVHWIDQVATSLGKFSRK